jgi:hypothetical protein
MTSVEIYNAQAQQVRRQVTHERYNSIHTNNLVVKNKWYDVMNSHILCKHAASTTDVTLQIC